MSKPKKAFYSYLIRLTEPEKNQVEKLREQKIKVVDIFREGIKNLEAKK